MPLRKLRLVSLVVETCRVVVEAMRRAGPILPLLIGLLFLQLWAGPKIPFADIPYPVANILLGAIDILVTWMMLLVVSRASLQA